MLENFLITVLILLSVLMISVILLQPDRSQGLAKNMSVLDTEKEGIEKFTEVVATLFLIVAVLFQIVR